jgi:hypothetical protein
MNPSIMFGKNDLMGADTFQNRFLGVGAGFGNDIADAEAEQQNGCQQITFKVVADGDNAGIEVANTDLLQGVGVGGVKLDDMRQFRAEMLNSLFVRINRQNIMAELDQRFGYAAAKATHANDNILAMMTAV